MKLHSLPAIVALAALTPPALAQPCNPQWSDEFFQNPMYAGAFDAIFASVVFDDGSEPALYLAGGFTSVDPQIRGIGRWNGSHWSNVGTGLASTVRALAVFDDGSGPALYAGGNFVQHGLNRLARWDGTSWSPVGPGADNFIYRLDVIDVNGAGPSLYAGGSFQSIGGIQASRVARWDGQNWFPLGDGVNNIARAFAAYDDGTGAALYIAGEFTTAGGIAANRIVRWDGTSWSPVGDGLQFGNVIDLRSYDDGSGSQLFASGSFTQPFPRIARWNGTVWSGVGAGFSSGGANRMIPFDDGTGMALYAVGWFTGSGTQLINRVARWDGQVWSPLGAGISGLTTHTAAIFDDGQGEALYVGGNFDKIGAVPSANVGRWRNNAWSGLSNGLAPYQSSAVWALAAFDDGSGPAIYVGGRFEAAGGRAAANIARWDGSQWSPLAEGLPWVNALEVYDDGAGPAVYAATQSTPAGSLFRWTGEVWNAIPPGFGFPNSLQAHDDGSGPSLFASGFNSSTQSHTPARWDGQQWHDLAANMNNSIRALRSLDLGGGPRLFVGGDFTQVAGAPANRIAQWDGSSWSSLSDGLGGPVRALEVFDDGAGPLLHAGGSFTVAGGGPADYIARWTGTSWQPLNAELGGPISAMMVFNDGNGPSLYVGGSSNFGGIARWDGGQWYSLGTSLSGAVGALASFNHTTFPQLFAGGTFTAAGGHPSRAFARWSCTTEPPQPCYANCDNSTTPPTLNIDDFTCFINEFAIAKSLPHEQQLTHYANCDHSTTAPILNVDDFTCFINAFAAGCP